MTESETIIHKITHHLDFVRTTLRERIELMKPLAEAGNLHAAGHISGIETALLYVGIFDTLVPKNEEHAVPPTALP
jgi:hypothetical protein